MCELGCVYVAWLDAIADPPVWADGLVVRNGGLAGHG